MQTNSQFIKVLPKTLDGSKQYTSSAWFEGLILAIEKYQHPMMKQFARQTLQSFLNTINGIEETGGSLALGLTMESVSDLELIVNFSCDLGMVIPTDSKISTVQSSLRFMQLRICRDATDPQTQQGSSFDEFHSSLRAYQQSFKKESGGRIPPDLSAAPIHLLRAIPEYRPADLHQSLTSGPDSAKYFRVWITFPTQSWELTYYHLPLLREHHKFTNLIKHLGKKS